MPADADTHAVTEADIKAGLGKVLDFQIKYTDPLNRLEEELKLFLQLAGSQAEKDSALQKGINWFTSLPPEINSFQKWRTIFAMPQKTEAERNAKRAEMEKISKWVIDNLFLLVGYGLGKISNYLGVPEAAFADLAVVLLEQARLAAGEQPAEPAEFVRRVNRLLAS